MSTPSFAIITGFMFGKERFLDAMSDVSRSVRGCDHEKTEEEFCSKCGARTWVRRTDNELIAEAVSTAKNRLVEGKPYLGIFGIGTRFWIGHIHKTRAPYELCLEIPSPGFQSDIARKVSKEITGVNVVDIRQWVVSYYDELGAPILDRS